MVLWVTFPALFIPFPLSAKYCIRLGGKSRREGRTR
jgi:hypothetical protein